MTDASGQRVLALIFLFLAMAGAGLGAQPTQPQPQTGPKLPTPVARKVGDGLYKLDTVDVDTNKREVRVAGTINRDVTTLEFVANTRNGAKAYESAITVDSSATVLNAALLMLGLDPGHARVPTRHFDPVAPKGDAVEVFVTAQGPSGKTIRIEELLYDQRTKAPLANGPWVYTGSAFASGRFMAEADGVVIGFVHSPAPLIENPRSGAVDAYGQVVLNTRIPGLAPGTPVTLTIRVAGGAKK